MTAGTITEAVKAGGLEGKCPVDHTQVQQVPTPAPEQAKCPVDHTKVQKVPAPENEKCPVEHTKVTVEESRSSDATTSTESTQPLSSDSVQTSATPQKLTSAQYIQAQQAMSAMYSEDGPALPSECPMSGGAPGSADNGMDPDNMMPPPNQRPAYDQPFPLQTNRETSSIPRAGTGKNWVYPSEQMFWNAMTRKGWNWRTEPEEVNPETVTEIIKIHNFNNERAWVEIMLWESFYSEECGNPELVKFAGKPKDLSPRARFRTWMGYTAPFDRHDWVVDRCGTPVRYILDYYDTGIEEDGGNSVEIDVRPALDSFAACKDRAKVFLLRHVPSVATTLFEYPMVPVGTTHETKTLETASHETTTHVDT